MVTDLIGQEVKIGDWISTVPRGARSVEVGKVVAFTKTGNPTYRTSSSGIDKAVGLTVEFRQESYNPPNIQTRYDGTTFERFKEIEYRKPHFIKINPTRELELNYENNEI